MPSYLTTALREVEHDTLPAWPLGKLDAARLGDGPPEVQLQRIPITGAERGPRIEAKLSRWHRGQPMS